MDRNISTQRFFEFLIAAILLRDPTAKKLDQVEKGLQKVFTFLKKNDRALILNSEQNIYMGCDEITGSSHSFILFLCSHAPTPFYFTRGSVLSDFMIPAMIPPHNMRAAQFVAAKILERATHRQQSIIRACSDAYLQQ